MGLIKTVDFQLQFGSQHCTTIPSLLTGQFHLFSYPGSNPHNKNTQSASWGRLLFVPPKAILSFFLDMLMTTFPSLFHFLRAFLQPLKLTSSNKMSNKNEQNWFVTSNLTFLKEKLLALKYLSLYLQAKDGHTSDPTSHQQMNEGSTGWCHKTQGTCILEQPHGTELSYQLGFTSELLYERETNDCFV